MTLTTEEFVGKYKKLTRSGKHRLSGAFMKEYDYKTAEPLRKRIRGEQEFLEKELEFLSKEIDKCKVATRSKAA